MRRAIIERNGSTLRDKQESLDYIDVLQVSDQAIHGLEIVRLMKHNTETTMYKTVWYASQENVYELARTFIKEQMVGGWNYAEFKS